MEENKNNQNKGELNNPESNNPEKDKIKSNPKESEEKKESKKKVFFTRPEEGESLHRILSKNIYHSNYDNLSNYLSYDFNINRLSSETENFRNRNLLSYPTLDNQLKLADEINELRKKLKASLEDLKDTQADREKKIAEFEKLKAELTAKEKTNHILTRISEDGRKKLLESEPFHIQKLK